MPRRKKNYEPQKSAPGSLIQYAGGQIIGHVVALWSDRGAQAQPMRRISANDRINIGIIGPGSRGQELVRQLLRTPGVDIAAQCDVYEPRFAEVNELVGKKVPAYKDYRELLERKDMDAIFIATPPVFHAKYAIAAMESGRPVYGEKTLGFTPEDSANIVDACERPARFFRSGIKCATRPGSRTPSIACTRETSESPRMSTGTVTAATTGDARCPTPAWNT